MSTENLNAIGVTAVAVTKKNGDGELYLDWLLEGGICALERPGVVLLATDGASLTGDDGHGEVYTLPQPAGYMAGAPLLSTAAQDVLAERNRQITAEGWTPAHDDEHASFEMADAAGCYAHAAAGWNTYAARDRWPWSLEWWKPSTPRRDLVKAGALILAEIERLDRAAAPAVIEVLPVERDELGHWTHPAWPQDGEENAIPITWFKDNGLQVVMVEFEHDAPEELADAYFENGQPEACKDWQPSQPTGEGWFVFSIHETDDGPVCVWVRHAEQAEQEQQP
jgi:hypothetical protein